MVSPHRFAKEEEDETVMSFDVLLQVYKIKCDSFCYIEENEEIREDRKSRHIQSQTKMVDTKVIWLNEKSSEDCQMEHNRCIRWSITIMTKKEENIKQKPFIAIPNEHFTYGEAQQLWNSTLNSWSSHGVSCICGKCAYELHCAEVVAARQNASIFDGTGKWNEMAQMNGVERKRETKGR